MEKRSGEMNLPKSSTGDEASRDDNTKEGIDEGDAPVKSKYDRKKSENERSFKAREFSKTEFKGGEMKLNKFLNLMTKTDRRESTGAFNVVVAITVSETGEINYLKVTSGEKKKVKSKYLEEAERIILMMPKWEPALKSAQPIEENTGFNVWFWEK